MNLLLVLIGTGGHIIPLLPLIPELKREDFKVFTVSRMVGVERKLVKDPDLIITLYPFLGPKAILALIIATIRVYRFMKIKKIRAVLASGSFGSVPAIVAAILLRTPYFLLELNRIPGRMVRVFATRARAVFVALPLVRGLKGRVIETGLPLRDGFKELKAQGDYILIMGGSQGARFLNHLAIYLSERTDEPIQVITGLRDYEWMRKKGDGLEVIPFTEEPWAVMRSAKVVISRAGGLATYELASCQIPMILIPYPYATDDHQRINGDYYVERSGALVIEEGTVEEVGDQILSILKSKEYIRLRMRTPPVDGRDRIIHEVKRLCLVG